MPDATSSSVSCAPSPVLPGSAASCTVTVSDTAASGPSAPTGPVSFASTPSTGSFAAGGSCTLAPVSGSAAASSCHLSFTPAAAGNYTVTASYAGDGVHAPGTAAGALARSRRRRPRRLRRRLR